MKHFTLVPILATLALAACAPAVPGDSDSSVSVSSAWSSSSMAANDDIQVDNPLPGQKVASPLMVFGRARGTWFFEASFPVKLLDAQGAVLAQGPAQAQGEWMTEDFVPFSIQLSSFAPPAGSTGTLVLEKDNPSGLPENAASVEIPVTF